MLKPKTMFPYSLNGQHVFCQSWLTRNFSLLCCRGRPLASGKHKTKYFPRHLSDLTG